MKATSNQLMLADSYGVPWKQAHTIKAEKVRALDYICMQNMLKRQREWM